jgi:SRSO17 transposase
MSRLHTASSEERFRAFVEELVGVIGHADRAGPLRDYCTGLLVPAERKSVEPMAAITAPSRVAAQHQSLLHFVGQSPWSDEAVLAKVASMVTPAIESIGPIEAWIIDDTSFPKKGKHSVGVARQYSGQLGKQDNCQVAVSLSIANDAASLPVAYRLYLPQDWADDTVRRQKAGVPEDVVFKTKPMIALEQIIAACDAGVPRGVVLMDAGYGADTKLRSGVTELGLTYAAGILPHTSMWTRNNPPPSPRVWSGRGRPPKLIRRDREHQPASARTLALGLPDEAWTEITWREGCDEPLASRFARVRVRPAHRDYNLSEARPEEWLLIEWPLDEDEPSKYWLSTFPESMPFDRMVQLTKMRWRIERDYLELKQELGLAHYEGRGWRGFHHHATLYIASYGFLIAERARIPPSGPASTECATPAVPGGRRSRSAATTTRETRAELYRNRPKTPHNRTHTQSRSMSLLCTQISTNPMSRQFMTQ